MELDQRFVRRLTIARPSDIAMVEAVFGLTEALGITVVAEGVENRIQQRTLDRIGPMLHQGHRYARAQAGFPGTHLPGPTPPG